MTLLASVAFWTTLGFVVVQSVLVRRFVGILRRGQLKPRAPAEAASETPAEDSSGDPVAVAIVLCVRGADPSLEACLNSLLGQQYVHRKIHVVGDAEQDPGIQLARRFAAEYPGQIEVFINRDLLETCGLKCSHLVHVLQRLRNDYEYCVLVDADTVPPSDWLDRMLEPFADPQVRVATGIRWFEVVGPRLGTWVRYTWNTAAIVQMVCYGIPWGGSLAIRTSFLDEADVLSAWSHGFCEDTMLQSLARRVAGRVEVVPEAVIRSSEETTLGRCLSWIARQLLTARLHHPRWPLVLGHGLLTGLLAVGLPVLLLASLIAGNGVAALWSAAAWLLLQISNFGLLNWIESPVRSGRAEVSSVFRSPLRFVASMFMTQCCYPWALLQATVARQVEWRQIEYRIDGRQIKMLEYRPYQQESLNESL